MDTDVPAKSSSTPWIVGRVETSERRLRVICLPQAGAGAGAFAGWRAHLPAGVELAPVELPGRGTRAEERLPDSLAETAEQLFAALAGEFDTPFVLFGHSLGGLLAHQVTLLLERHGGPAPLATVVAAARAPHRPPEAKLSELRDVELLRWLVAQDAVPRELFRYPDFLRTVLAGIRKDFTLADGHVLPAPSPVRTPLHVLGGSEDSVAPAEHLHHWSACAAGEYSLAVLEGGHDFPRTTPAAVLAALRGVLPQGTWPDHHP
ncbi:thioesterase II family protein [Kitasatospora xanthocidica]|uniref:thioesterase II family protein n=1 Tax=Kitasatospora xanthocidica TaxID=83382 RepID=UPI001676CD94|nr:alpha/beta fold hydrolase [Kitasatospora xanthocidica]